MKKILLASVFFFFIAIIPQAVAQTQGFVPLAPIPGLTDAGTLSASGTNTLAFFFNNLYKFLIGIAAVLAIIQIIWAGLEIAINKDSVSKITDEKGKIYNAIFGLVLVLSPALVFSIINPKILNLSLNLPALETATRPVSGSLGTGSASTVPLISATECTTQYDGPYLKTAICPPRVSPASYACDSTRQIQIILPCRSTNSATGACDVNSSVYCTGVLQVVFYYFKGTGITGSFGFGKSESRVVPRDAQAVGAFTSACTAIGSKVTENAPRYSIRPCPPDAGTMPNYDATKYSGVECENVALICRP